MDYEFNGSRVAVVDDPESNVRMRFFQGYSTALDSAEQFPTVGIKIQNRATGDEHDLILDATTAMQMLTSLVRATNHIRREDLKENG